ncbi:MAG: hypothetical protein HOW73_03615 [Polyangiaceae bacterium]|nr:hypothetical protein [Polyangiaceae bacterium]
MNRPHRGTSKLKKKQARTSTARLRQRAPLHHAKDVVSEAHVNGRSETKKKVEPSASPPLIPVRTAMTPRPDIAIPAVSLENVDWEDGREPLSPLHRWEQAERQLERKIEELGLSACTRRFEPKDGRFVWLDEAQVSVAEARAQVLATWVKDAQRLVMAWADPLLQTVGIARLEEMPDSIAVDQPTARELALRAAEATGAEFVANVEAPHGEHYLAIRSVRPALTAAPLTPGSPVGLVLRGLADLRRSVSQRDEPTDVLRARFLSLGKTILVQSEGVYRETEWVGRLHRAGKVLTQLAGRLVPPTFSAIAAGRQADEWLAQSVAVDLIDAIKLLEDEWGAFA